MLDHQGDVTLAFIWDRWCCQRIDTANTWGKLSSYLFFLGRDGFHLLSLVVE